MNAIAHRLEQYLLGATTWIFFTVVLFITNGLMTNHSGQNWGAFLPYLAFTLLLAAPVLLFSYARSYLRERLAPWGYGLIWTAVFIGFPLLLFTNGVDVPDYFPASDPFYILYVGGGLLLAEGLLSANDFLRQWTGRLVLPQWFSLEVGILSVLGCLAVGLATLEVLGEQIFDPAAAASPKPVRVGRIGTFLSHSVQYFLILLVYYGFYLINHYLLISRVLKERGVIYYVFALTGTVLLLYPVAAELISWLPMVRWETTHPVTRGQIFNGMNMLVPLSGMLVSIPFILMVQWYRQGRTLVTLERDRTRTELSLLKHQLNPHFFFNTLNNLYALSLTRDPATPEVILRLSELMRYVLYRGQEARVPLADEVAYLEDYLELQSLRLHQELELKFERDVADARCPIPPLLFITLVENAFKHGIEPAESDSYLYLSLRQTDRRLLFTCQNSLPSAPDPRDTPAGGIGLSNLRQRLDLLYPGRYELTTTQSSQAYHAILTIDLP